ncbi:unnamed protein product [Lactuca saligna]|uniref:Uncharacterized protein n=1 Tax=Lactuca saligna TaxID=75948 RepID=A0AA35YZV6_LACSI|nr:unnamed protein product [Lactuca saligna]
MCQQALRRHLPFTFPLDAEIDQEFNPSKEAQQTATGDVPDPTNVLDDPPMKCTSEEAHKPPYEKDLSDNVMFRDDNINVDAISIPSTFNMLHKPSSSKLFYDFGLSSSSEE